MFDNNPDLPSDQPQIVELVQKTIGSLHNIPETPAVKAQVRLYVEEGRENPTAADKAQKSRSGSESGQAVFRTILEVFDSNFRTQGKPCRESRLLSRCRDLSFGSFVRQASSRTSRAFTSGRRDLARANKPVYRKLHHSLVASSLALAPACSRIVGLP